MVEDISAEEWSIWRSDKITQVFFNTVANHREEAIRALAYGHFTSPTKQNIMIGAINAYTHVLDAKFEEGAQ